MLRLIAETQSTTTSRARIYKILATVAIKHADRECLAAIYIMRVCMLQLTATGMLDD